MSSQLLVSFTTFLLENQNFLSSASIIEDSSLDYGSLNIRGTYLDSSVRIYKQNLIKLNGSTFVSRKAVDKDLHTSFNFKLVSGNIYDCVHK